MTSLFLLLEKLFQSLFRVLLNERKQEKHPVVSADYRLPRATLYRVILAVLIQTFLQVSQVFVFNVCFFMQY